MMKKLFLLCLLSGSLIQAQSLERQVIGSAGTSFSNATAQMDFTVGELVVSTITDGTTELTQGFHQTNLSVAIKVSPAAFLQGALYNSAVMSVMDDDLRAAGYVPTTSPYADAITTTSGVLAVTGTDAIVDWIWVELRDDTDNTLVIDSSSALMQADGDIVGVDGTSPLSFDVSVKDYYVAVNHRNHLGIMSANTVALSSTTVVVDFRDNSTATFGSNAQIIGDDANGMVTGDYAMWMGDVNGNSEVKFSLADNDVDVIKDDILAAPGNIFGSISYEYSGYFNSDVDMSGVAKFSLLNNDSDIIKDNIIRHPGNIFASLTYIIVEVLP